MKTFISQKNNFLFFLILCFVFMTSSALALSSDKKEEFLTAIKRLTNLEKKSFPSLPILSKEASFPIISAQAVMVVDVPSGVTLYEKDPDESLLPASTTKILTALVAMDYYTDGEVLTVQKVAVDGQKMGLRVGEKMKVLDLLYGLLVYSANDAAEVLAQNYNGGREAFVGAMNQKAEDLHLDHSYFTNPTGLDTGRDSIVSSARDLVKISLVAMQNSRFAEIVKTKEITVKSLDGKIAHKLVNVNELIDQVPGVLGIKTGWTESARENLVTYIDRDGHRVIIVLLGSQDRFGETKELIDWIFNNYSWQEVKVPYSP